MNLCSNVTCPVISHEVKIHKRNIAGNLLLTVKYTTADVRLGLNTTHYY